MTAVLSPGHERDSGFTLVEVLVSLALIALITVYLASGFDHVRRVATLSDELDGAVTLEAVRSYLAHSLANAQGPPPQQGQAASLSFAGQSNMIAYVTPSDGLLDRGGLYRIELSGDESELVLRRELFPSGDAEGARDRPRTIEAGRLQMRYWGLAEGEEAPRWHAAWNEAKSLPVLVEIRLEPAARRAVWPPLVVRLLQGGSTAAYQFVTSASSSSPPSAPSRPSE
jgi:general secretion pathway protein J